MDDLILKRIREVKQEGLGNDKDWDWDDGYGELKNLVFTALDVADELREAVIFTKSKGGKIAYGKDVPANYKGCIIDQLIRMIGTLVPEIKVELRKK